MNEEHFSGNYIGLAATEIYVIRQLSCGSRITIKLDFGTDPDPEYYLESCG